MKVKITYEPDEKTVRVIMDLAKKRDRTPAEIVDDLVKTGIGVEVARHLNGEKE